MKKAEKDKKTSKKRLIFACFGLFFLLVAVSVTGQILYQNHLLSSTKFYQGTTINGINVSGLSKSEACELAANSLLQNRNDIEIELTHQDRKWIWKGDDFQPNPNLLPMIESSLRFGRNGGFLEKIDSAKALKKQGFDLEVSYRFVLGGIDEKVDSLIAEIHQPAVEPFVLFRPKELEMFQVSEGKSGIAVDKEAFYYRLDEALSALSPQNRKVSLAIPSVTVLPEKTARGVRENIVKRSQFSTGFETSPAQRKANISLALSHFDGRIIQPGEEVSFNKLTGSKTEKNGWQKANIILSGQFVEGVGGGICQASTTLFNAALLAGLEIKEMFPHSLPVSYVPMGLDAMVYDGYADMRFSNNTELPVYIRAYAKNNRAYVELYGEPIENGISYKTRSELSKTLPHKGDSVVKDTEGKYCDKVSYVGEYYRVNFPAEGYEAKAYLEKWKDGKLLESKLLRTVTYKPRRGLVMEGTEELGEGMALPPQTVKIIPPQKTETKTEEETKKQIQQKNPTGLNP